VPGGPPPGRPGVPPWGAPPAGDVPGLTLPNLLLGLGTALIVVAAIVFAAVSWSRLGSAVQGLVLVALTAGAAWGTRALVRRGLTATAEAMSVVTVALLPVDVHALREAAQAFSWDEGPGGDPLAYWCLGIWAVAAVTWWFGRFSGTRAPRIIAAVAAQVPVPLFVVDRPVEAAGAQLLCLAQAALVAVLVRRSAPDHGTAGARVAGALGAAGTWLVVTPVALAVAVDGGTSDTLAGAGVLAVAAAVAGLAGVLWQDSERVRPLALGTATLVGLVAAMLALEPAVDGDGWAAATAAVCATVLVAALQVPRRWGRAPAAVAAIATAIASLPVVGTVAVSIGVALAAGDPAWARSATAPVRTLTPGDVDLLPAGLVAIHLAVLAAVALGAARRLGRPVAAAGLCSVAAAALVAGPVLADAPAWAAMALALGAAAVPVVVLAARPGGCVAAWAGVAVAAVVGFGALALVWGAVAPVTTLVAVGGAGVLAVALAVLAVRDGAEPVALAAAGAAVVAVAAESGLGAAAGGAEVAWCWVAAGWAAAGTALALVALAPAPAAPAPRDRAQDRDRDRAAVLRSALAAAQGTGVALYVLALAVVSVRGGPGAVAALVPAAIVGAGWATVRSVDGGQALAALWSAPALVVAVCAESGLVTAAADGDVVTAWLAVVLTAAAATGAAAVVDPGGTRATLDVLVDLLVPEPAGASAEPPDSRADRAPADRAGGTPAAAGGVAALAGELAGALAHVAGLLALAVVAADAASPDAAVTAASVGLGAGAVAAAAHALRPGRRAAAVWAAAEATVLVWVQLAAAGVEAPEAYTAPVAVAFLVAAVVAHRVGVADRYPSWWVHGPWLVMALAPTVAIALDDPGLVRQLGGLAAGAAVLVAGAVTRRRAPVDVGAVAVAVLGLRQLAPVVAELPNWATLGGCGLLLLAVGATFEERRRNVSTVLDRYAALN
jgi:hypothetical protein